MMTTRGVRNNNPGNIRKGDSEWQGMSAQQTDTDFVQFVSPEYGIRALAKILKSYKAAKINTISKIIMRYAPSSENDTAAYISSVLSRMGRSIGPDEQIDIDMPVYAVPLVKAIIAHECAGYAYPEETIVAGLRMAGYAIPPISDADRAMMAATAPPEGAKVMSDGDGKVGPDHKSLGELVSAAVLQGILAANAAQQAAAASMVTTAPAAPVQGAKDFRPPLVGPEGAPVAINPTASMGSTDGLATTPIVAPTAIVASTGPSLRSPYATSAGVATGLGISWLWDGVVRSFKPDLPPIPVEIAAPLTVLVSDLFRAFLLPR